ncbi:hypothetical protein N431DRAFT_484380 [Stipitochalara longipes BDJ]|nr:hypothetical protein N431DRAFT_484380 [Stipitochalara longipes BDJ]
MSHEMSNNQSRKRHSDEPLETTPSKRARVEEPERSLEERETEPLNIGVTNNAKKRKSDGEGGTGTAKKAKVRRYWSESDLNDWYTPEGNTGTFPTGTDPSIAPPGFRVPVPAALVEEAPELLEQPREDITKPMGQQPGGDVLEPVEEPKAYFPESVEQPQRDILGSINQPQAHFSHPVEQPRGNVVEPVEQPQAYVIEPLEQTRGDVPAPVSQPQAYIPDLVKQPQVDVSRLEEQLRLEQATPEPFNVTHPEEQPQGKFHQQAEQSSSTIPSLEEQLISVQAKPTVPPRKVKKVPSISTEELQRMEDEEEAEFARKRSQKSLSLFARLHHSVVNSNHNWWHDGTNQEVSRRRHYGDGDDDDDVDPLDADFQDVDYEYGEDEDGGDLDAIRKRREEAEDPTYDPNFVAEEISDAGLKQKYGMKIPDYKPKGPGWAEQQEEQRKRDEEAKAWKMLNSELGQGVTNAASFEYKSWHKECKAFFAQDKRARAKVMMDDGVPFPKIQAGFCTVVSRDCVRGEKLRICQHDVLRVLKGSGVQVDGEEWLERLKRERLRWHPDKFSNKMGKKWEAEAKELFQMIQALTEREKK